ncbi:MAG TPA: hypothetical protein VFV01_41755 [Spirillospora sp.]|nr:hypothetical protein [Spirillospora sp.]
MGLDLRHVEQVLAGRDNLDRLGRACGELDAAINDLRHMVLPEAVARVTAHGTAPDAEPDRVDGRADHGRNP